MTWNWQVAIDLWTSGLAGGGFLAAFLINRLTGGRARSLVRRATYVGIPLATIGVIFLVIDLGKPGWFWHLFASWRPLSPMFWGTWILFVWLVLAVALTVLWVAESFSPKGKPELAGALISALHDLAPFTNLLSWVLLVVSALLTTYTGVLLSTSNRALWSGSPMLPAVFVVSAVLMGVAILILAFGRSLDRVGVAELVNGLGKASAVLIGLEIVALAVYVIWLASASSVTSEAVSVLVSGSLAVPFWIGVGVVGLLVPLVLELYAVYKDEKYQGPLMVVSSLCVLFGGIVLRLSTVIGGQM